MIQNLSEIINVSTAFLHEIDSPILISTAISLYFAWESHKRSSISERRSESYRQNSMRAIVDVDFILTSCTYADKITYQVERAFICSIGPGPALSVEIFCTPFNGKEKLIWSGILAGKENYSANIASWSEPKSENDAITTLSLSGVYSPTRYSYEVCYTDCFGNPGRTHASSDSGDNNDVLLCLHLPEMRCHPGNIAPRAGNLKCRQHSSVIHNVYAGDAIPKCKKSCIFEYVPDCDKSLKSTKK